MSNTRTEMLEHMSSSGASESQAFEAACSWLDRLFAEHPNTRMGTEFLEESFYLHVVDQLETGPLTGSRAGPKQ